MMFPLDAWDLTILVAAFALILLATYELLFSYSDNLTVLISEKRLRYATATFSIFFIIGVIYRISTTGSVV